MSPDLRSLLWRLLIGAGAALLAVAVTAPFGLRLSLPIPLALGLGGGALSWLLRFSPSRADHMDAPELDLDADYALPHAQDMRVRRLEDTIHGSQPSRRMTTRGLGRILGEVADERARDPQAPPLSADLRTLITEARRPDAEAHPVRPVDRRTLHRYLRELSLPGE